LPCWNWQLDHKYPYLAHYYPVFHHHFIAGWKPNRMPVWRLPVRFNQAYRDFMTQHVPEAVAELATRGMPRPLRFGEQARIMVDNLLSGHVASSLIDQYPDPYLARL